MTTVTIKDVLVNQDLREGLKKLAKAPVPFGTGKLIISVLKELEKILEKAQALRTDIMNQYATKNEDGTLKILETGHYDIAGKEAEVDKALEEAFSKSVEICLPKIPAPELHHARLTALEWEAIDTFITTGKPTLKLL